MSRHHQSASDRPRSRRTSRRFRPDAQPLEARPFDKLEKRRERLFALARETNNERGP